MKKQITYLDYDKVQICTGTILEASINVKAKKPAYVLKIDFGEKNRNKKLPPHKLRIIIKQKN